MSKLGKILSSRLFFVSILILLQISAIVLPMMFLSTYFIPLFLLFEFISLLIAVNIVNRNNNPEFKIAWLIPVLCFPVSGPLLYLMFGRTHLNKKNTAKLKVAVDSSKDIIRPDTELLYRLG